MTNLVETTEINADTITSVLFHDDQRCESLLRMIPRTSICCMSLLSESCRPNGTASFAWTICEYLAEPLNHQLQLTILPDVRASPNLISAASFFCLQELISGRSSSVPLLWLLITQTAYFLHAV